MHGLSKRDLLKRALFGGGALGLRAFATGLPPAFLLNRGMAVAQETQQPTYLILSNAAAGHPSNANTPGTYPANPNNNNDPLRQIDHPQVADLGNGVQGTINGVDFTAASFETPVDLTLGSNTYKAAGPWAALPQGVLNRATFFHHATYANAHPEFANVMQFHGAVKAANGRGQEMLSSAVAQETAGLLGTLTNQPVNVGGNQLTFEGRPLGTLDPLELKSLFGAGAHPTGVPDASQIVRLRDAVLDDVYRSVRESGSGAQKKFLDRYAMGREQAAQLGDQLGTLLANINSNNSADEARTAVALFRLNVTPVVVMQMRYGGDNHRDNNLGNEVTQTIETINSIRTLWNELVAADMQDRVTFANLDVFGRKLLRNSSGGRDHNRDHHTMLMFGPGIAPGVVGGLEPSRNNNGSIRDFKATAIGDIPFDQTLESAGKTLAKAVGIAEDRINTRILGGQVVSSAIQS